MQQQRHLTASEWDALAKDPQFVALLRARRRFIVPSTIFFLLFYLALPLGVVCVPDLMRRTAFGPLTVAYAFGLAQFIMAWILLAAYMMRARSFDARAQALVTRASADFER
jgi:uncharacterized membrane protein (DUF485 family)